MKAILLNKNDDYPKLVDFDIPKEYLKKEKVQVIAAALNHRDLWIVKGQYAGLKYPIILGSDCVGTHLGKKVIINPGQFWGPDEKVQSKQFKILGLPDHGTMAEYVYVDKQFIYPKPEHLTDIEASALPLGGLTAYRALFSRGNIEKGEKILISGIGGGVALFALQFALAEGLEVYVTSSSPKKIEKAIELGAKGGFDYTDSNYAEKISQSAGEFDVILDSAAGESFNQFLKIIKPAGRIIIYGGTRGKIQNLIPQIIFWKQISILGSTMGSDKDFRDMLDFVNRHKIKPVVDSVFDFINSTEAFKRMERGEQFGKIVLQNK
ncbi:MAG TPA: alcohol dehydrogenase [Bacteroidetes bacterium]|nr:alcohol dehydrogenase [Bacteroidota bacterium]